jgi:Tir chaperone protein (CesT) family
VSNTLAYLQSQMQALGPATEWIEAIVQDDNQSWSVQTLAGIHVGVSYAPSPSRLILSSSLGRPEDSERESVYSAMLCTNLLYADQASLRVALTGPEGELMLISEAIPTDWTLSDISDALSGFAETVQNFIDGLGLSIEDLIENIPNYHATVRV